VISLYTYSHLSCNFSARSLSYNELRTEKRKPKSQRSVRDLIRNNRFARSDYIVRKRTAMGNCKSCHSVDDDHYIRVAVKRQPAPKPQLHFRPQTYNPPPRRKKRRKKRSPKSSTCRGAPSLVSVSAKLVAGTYQNQTVSLHSYSPSTPSLGDNDSQSTRSDSTDSLCTKTSSTSRSYSVKPAEYKLELWESPEMNDWRVSGLDRRLANFEEIYGHGMSRSTLRAFLIAYPEESDQAMHEMIRKAVDWRRELYPDIFDMEMSKDVTSKVPMCIYNTDDFGHPIWYMDLSRYERVRAQSEQEVMEKYIIRTLLHIRDIEKYIAEKSGRPGTIWAHIAVFNFAGVSIWDVKALRKLIILLLDISNTMFGNMTYKVFFINCGRSFRMMSSLFKPFLSKTTLDNTHILGGSEYLEQMSQCVELDRIPKIFGGTSTKPWVDGGIVLPDNIGYKHDAI